ncbi:MAG: CDP-glycerol glycerophosphotransferase family protein [Planctomycetota bacterium]
MDNNNFFNPNASFLVGSFQIIQCWHGTPIKNMEREKTRSMLRKLVEIFMKSEYNKFEYFITPCELASKVFRRRFNKTEVLELGYPRNDILFDREFFWTENLSQVLGFGQFSKILLYAPTFRKAEESVNPFDSEFVERINETLNIKNYLLLIKQHPYAKGISFAENYSNIKDVSDKVDDIQELLINVDVLISDYSSVMFDFALTEKLQLFYPFDIDEYRKNTGEFYFEYAEQNLPGLIITDKNDLIRKMEHLETLIEDQQTKNRIKNFKNKYNRYIDGNSCKRIFQYLQLTERRGR